MAWATHYVGDLRSVNNDVLDTYQLKSLDGIVEGSLGDQTVTFSRDNTTGKVNLHLTSRLDRDNFALRESYDYVIRCLGFTFDFSLFHE